MTRITLLERDVMGLNQAIRKGQAFIAQSPQLVLKSIPDEQLAELLCQKRAIFSLPYTATDSHGVGCLLPLRRATSLYLYREEFIIARLTTDVHEFMYTYVHVCT